MARNFRGDSSFSNGHGKREAHARLKLKLPQWLLAWSLGAGLVMLAGCSVVPQHQMASRDNTAAVTTAASPAPQTRSTLGTQWGEGRDSRVITVEASRISPNQPQAQGAMRYTDEGSIRRALGGNADLQRSVMLAEGRLEWSVVDGSGGALPIFSARGSNNNNNSSNDFMVAGRHGDRYELVYVNRSQRYFEVVATVDGLDVLSGQPGSTAHRGYLIGPGETRRIDGFRKSNTEVAAFRFSSKDNAYASNTPAGNPSNIGVIGTAVFEVNVAQNAPVAAPRNYGTQPAPDPFPADRGRYAPGPQYR